MHEIEPTGFCTLKEYYRYLEKRKQAAEISLGGLYLMLAAFRKDSNKREASKFPIRAKLVETENSHLATVTVDLLDVDLQPKESASFTMIDGIAMDPGLCERSSGQLVKEMYIKDYEDYLPDGPAQSSVGEEANQLELVAV